MYHIISFCTLQYQSVKYGKNINRVKINYDFIQRIFKPKY